MIMHDFKDYFEKKVKVKTLENETFQGELTGFENGVDSSSGQDEIELFAEGVYIGIEIPDIESVELLYDLDDEQIFQDIDVEDD